MNVKVCDLKSITFEEDFKSSLVNTGFAVITNHGIEDYIIKEAQMGWRLFYLNEPEYKAFYANKEDPNMGYMGYKKETAVGAKVADLKEFYHWKPNHKLPYNTEAVTRFLFERLEEISQTLLRALDVKYEGWCSNSDNTILRTLYYPALDFSKEPEAVRAAAHEDINLITLLIAASAPGLQVLDKEGNWHDVPHEENSIVVNAGDMLQLSSHGLYKSTTHRVINPDNSRSDRVSMPFFVHPRSETILVKGVTAKAYLDERLDQIYGRKK